MGPIATGRAGVGFFSAKRVENAKAKSGNILFRRKCGQVCRKNEQAGWWEWANKEHVLNRRML